jgi:hypothetical protein
LDFAEDVIDHGRVFAGAALSGATHVVDDDFGALARKRQGMRPAEAAPSARNDRNFPREQSHGHDPVVEIAHTSGKNVVLKLPTLDR